MQECRDSVYGRIFATRAGRAIGFLAFVFALAVGLILGAIFAQPLLTVLAALIAFAAAILVVIIALVIWVYHRKG